MARTASIDSYSTLGSSRMLSCLQKPRAQSNNSYLGDLSGMIDQGHELEDCAVSGNPAPGAMHHLLSCDNYPMTRSEPMQHSLQRDKTEPESVRAPQHGLELCTRCPHDNVPQHDITQCPRYSSFSPKNHLIETWPVEESVLAQHHSEAHDVTNCDNGVVYAGPTLHIVSGCQRYDVEDASMSHRQSDCPIMCDEPGMSTHYTENCSKFTVPQATAMHDHSQCDRVPICPDILQHRPSQCLHYSVEGKASKTVHGISTCLKHTVCTGQPVHEVVDDGKFLEGVPSETHLVEEDPQLINQGLELHTIASCDRCFAREVPEDHRISACKGYPLNPEVKEHPLRLCNHCGEAAKLNQHGLHDCRKGDCERAANNHGLSDDEMAENLLAANHRLQNDATSLDLRPQNIHFLQKDVKHVEAEDSVTHGLDLCSKCKASSHDYAHRISECPKGIWKSTLASTDNVSSRRSGGQTESADRAQSTKSSHMEQFYDACSSALLPASNVDHSKVPARSQSLASILDYTKATQWIRGLLSPYEGDESRLTTLPPRGATESQDTVAGGDHRSPNNTGRASSAGGTDTLAEGSQFNQAVGDLERLLNEALTLASNVVDHQVSDIQKPCRRPSANHSHCNSVPTLRARDSASEIIRKDDVSTRNTSNSVPENESNATPESSRDSRRMVPLKVPERKSSKGVSTHAMNVTDCSPPLVRVSAARSEHMEAPRQVEPMKYSEDIVDFHDYFSHPVVQAFPHQPTSQLVPVSLPEEATDLHNTHTEHGISLRRKSHISLDEVQDFSLAKSRRRQPIARDWSPIRKRFVATVACISTALVGAVLGIYAGIVPSIQYFIIDNAHVIVHGNTGCFLGLAIPTFFAWPLPLLHGRKPYILGGMILAMPLLFPQAVAVNTQRLEHTGPWRALLLSCRTLMGVCLGFASMNFHSVLTDLFGSSLMSSNPHQEVADNFDARRHGGGMGVWLGIWTWCWIGSLGIGFLIGAVIIDNLPPVWGFYVSIIFVAVVLLLNVICPEVRRSAFRRSVAEVRVGNDISRRLALGEVMMHRLKTGPRWWGEEMYQGTLLCGEMLRQPGFLVVAIYSSWIYAQVVLLILLLGSLASNLYRFHATGVGLLVACLSLGALLAVPFQKANIFSRSRQAQLDTNRATLENRFAWTSHLVRRTTSATMLPLSGICYACLSYGPPLSIAAPTCMAALVGFLSCLAIAECNGLIMESFDTSDLSPGMTGRSKNHPHKHSRRTNYSSFPRVAAGFAVIHSFAFALAAGATALAGRVTRNLGQQVASGVVAGVLLVFTVMLLLALARFKDVQIVPNSKAQDMDRLSEVRRKSTMRRVSMPDDVEAVMEEENAWKPVMIGNPISRMRRMNIFELGSMTRWQEIRRKNKMIDEGLHLNRTALGDGLIALDAQFDDLRTGATGLLRLGSNRSKGSKLLRKSENTTDRSQQSIEMDDFSFKSRDDRSAKEQPLIERDCLVGQSVTEETQDEMNAFRRRSINAGKRTDA